MEKGDIKLTPIMRHGYFIYLDEVTGEIFTPVVNLDYRTEDVRLKKIEIK